jgi:Holliday junction resolvase RusA-like endonuclease
MPAGSGVVTLIRFTLLGQPASKANSRQLVTIKGRPAFIKSPQARTFERDALRQIPSTARQRLTGPVRVTLRLYYASERPDLDEAVVLDVLQDRYHGHGEARVLVQPGVYRNDRQVREKHVYHAIDRVNPRCEVEVEPVHAQQVVLELEDLDALPF